VIGYKKGERSFVVFPSPFLDYCRKKAKELEIQVMEMKKK
jgi:hypothetical protein